MNFAAARAIADAILYEGYVLYPYRASAAKNQWRWQIGLVTPRDFAEAAGSDPWSMQTECIAEVEAGARLAIRVRALQMQQRFIEAPADANGDSWRAVQSMRVGERLLIAWDEAVVAEFARDALAIDAARHEWTASWELAATESCEEVFDDAGRLAARIRRRRQPATIAVRIVAERYGAHVKIRVRLENLTACAARTLAERRAVLVQSLAGTHTVLALENGAFVSLLDPPDSAAALTASCQNQHTWPVLVGRPGARDTMLSAPVILYDYPAVAPESPGDFCDATEIDEMLMLRVNTLTEEEKAEARATDVRAAAIVAGAGSASRDVMRRLHGAIRNHPAAPAGLNLEQWEGFFNPTDTPAPETACVEIGNARLARGSRVRLAPTRRADSMDICLAGRIATVTGVHVTVENKPYVAVALDDDPFAADGARFRRALFFHPDELIPIDDGGGPRA